MASALQVHGGHGRLHVVVGHVGVVRVRVVADARWRADGLGGHVHGLAHGLRGPEGQEIVHGVRGRPGPHHARGGPPGGLCPASSAAPGAWAPGAAGGGRPGGARAGGGGGGGGGRSSARGTWGRAWGEPPRRSTGRTGCTAPRPARGPTSSRPSGEPLGSSCWCWGLRRTGPSAPAPASSASSTPRLLLLLRPLRPPGAPLTGFPPAPPAADLVPEDPADGADGGHVVLVADPVRQQLVPDLPGEDARVPFLVGLDVLDHVRGGHARLGTADGSWRMDPVSFVARQDLADAAVGHAQLPARCRRAARPAAPAPRCVAGWRWAAGGR